MDAELRLITIPLSHYCEKGRWALDAAGLAYQEDGHAPALHRLAIARHRTTTVPVLVVDRGEVHRGSDRILAYAAARVPEAGLLPTGRAEREEVARWLGICDERLGPDVRKWFYTWVLDDPPAFVRLLGAGLGDRRRRALSWLNAPVRSLIRRHFGIGARSREQCAERVADVFASAADRRAGAPYLVGDRFTAADLAFAALGAPLVFPREYGVPLPRDSELPSALLEAIEGWRASRSGAAILETYRAHRSTPTPRPTPTTPGGVPR
jgi:glutathione S-transferase